MKRKLTLQVIQFIKRGFSPAQIRARLPDVLPSTISNERKRLGLKASPRGFRITPETIAKARVAYRLRTLTDLTLAQIGARLGMTRQGAAWLVSRHDAIKAKK